MTFAGRNSSIIKASHPNYASGSTGSEIATIKIQEINGGGKANIMVNDMMSIDEMERDSQDHRINSSGVN